MFAQRRADAQPLMFVYQAVQIASAPDQLHDLLRWMVYGQTPPRPLPPLPPSRQWLAMYRRRRVMQNGLALGLGVPAEIPASDVLSAAGSVSRMTQEEIASEVAELTQEEIHGFLAAFVVVPFPPDDATLRAMLAEFEAEAEAEGADEEAAMDEFMASPAAQYFFRAWWPCFVLYRDYPPRLLRAARNGDLDALDRLLRLDKYIVHDPRVARVIGDVMSAGSANDQKLIVNALKGRPKVRLTDSRLRAGLGALISQLAHAFGTKVTAREIQKLFDAIERVRSGNLSDAAIGAAGESWSKAIQRDRTWPGLPTQIPGQ